MKSNIERLNNVVGQINGINKMLTEEKDCIQVLTQLKAVKSAISSVMDNIVDDKINNCMSSLKAKDKKLLLNLKKYVKNN